MIGRTISHYRILEQIGAGGMGVVYRAHDERLDRDVALKVLSPALADDRDFLARFRREARTLSKLNHPNIATVHDFDSDDGTSFLVMEFIRGPGLANKVRSGPVPEKEVVRLGLQLLNGLCAAHAEGIIHRDLKPGNLRETLDGRLKILDFGLARTLHSDLDVTQSLATSGAVGTLPYMAPEQLRGENVDARTDLYSVGVVLYELATGSRPFPETFGPRLIDCILHQHPPSARELNPQLSSEIESVIRKALERDPERRYRSAKEMQDALEHTQEASPAEVTAGGVPSQAPPMEIAHVLFTDIVGYSKLAMDEQQSHLRKLQRLVRSTTEFERAKANDQLISLPTGDGMALVFFGEPEAPVRCALELGKILQEHPEIKLRMGVNSGPVYRVADINANRNVAGGGINIAQRVMDCGDAGHILVSKAVADVLGQLSAWRGLLHDLGDVEVKHGVLVHIYNLHTPEAGNSALPDKVSRLHDKTKAPSTFPWKQYSVGLATVLVLVISAGIFVHYRERPNLAPASDSFAKTPRAAVAVIGFRNISGHPGEDWISTSLSEDLTTELAASQKLRAVSGEEVALVRTNLALSNVSSFGKVTLAKIRKDLASDYVVSGAYLAAGSQVGDSLRVDFRLQNVESGDIIDAMQVSGTVGELSSFVKQTGAKLLGKLGVRTPQDEQSQGPSAALPADPAAARFYAQGLDKLRKFDPLGARDLLQRAVAAEPNLAMAHSALAEAWSALGYDKDAADEAKKAFNLSGTLSVEQRRAVEGRYYRLSSQWDKAIDTYRSLKGVYQDELAYALDLAEVQTRAGKGEDALGTLNDLKKNSRWKDDARVDYLEAEANESLSRAGPQHIAAAKAAEKASQNGASLLEAQAHWLDCAALRDLQEQKAAELACQKAQQVAALSGEQKTMARALTVLANIRADQGLTSQEMELRQQVLGIARRIGSQKDVVGALFLLANALARQGNNDEARKDCEEAIAIATTIGDRQQLLNAQFSLAAILSTQGENAAAMKMYAQALQTAREIKNNGGIIDGLLAVGQMSMQEGNLAAAQKSTEESIKVARESGMQNKLAASLLSLGDILMTRGDLVAARKNYEQASSSFQNLNDKLNSASATLSLAILTLEDGKQIDSEMLARQAAEQFAGLKQVDAEIDARNAIARALIAQGRLSEAQAELAIAKKVPAQDSSSLLALEITSDRLKGLSGKSAEAKRELATHLQESNKLKSVDLQFQVRLALAEIEGTADKKAARTMLQRIEIDAREKGYLLVAAKAARKQKEFPS